MHLQCTKKLLTKLKLKPKDLKESPDKDNFIENWHCNILTFDEVDTLLITNDKTIFSFLIYDFEVEDVEDFKYMVSQYIFISLKQCLV